MLINKMRHEPVGDWNNDPDDIRNIVGVVSRDWKKPLTWQILDPGIATVSDLLQAPIVYFNGHHSPSVFAACRSELARIRRERWFHLRRGLLQ